MVGPAEQAAAGSHQERSRKGFYMWKRLSVIWSLIKGDASQLWHAVRHPLAPPWLKWGTAGIVLYLVSPVDLIPDVIPVIGLLDDVILVPLAIRWLLKHLPANIRDDIAHRAGFADTTGTVIKDVTERR